MTLKDLIKSHHWLSVKTILLDLYPNVINGIDAYEEIYRTLSEMEIVNSDMQILLVDCYDDESGEHSHVDVSGQKIIDSGIKDDISYAIEFVPWYEWLGMEVSEETRMNFTDLEIIAHCLFEMTFIDFDEIQIQGNFSKIKGIADEYKNLTPEEKKRNTTSLDNFLKNLDEEDQ